MTATSNHALQRTAPRSLSLPLRLSVNGKTLREIQVIHRDIRKLGCRGG
jgi:hypothetical protein